MTHGRFAYQWNEMWAEAGQPHEQTEKKTHLRGRHWIFFSSRSSFSPSWTVRVRGRTDQALKPQPRVSGRTKNSQHIETQAPVAHHIVIVALAAVSLRSTPRTRIFSVRCKRNKKKLQFGLLFWPRQSKL